MTVRTIFSGSAAGRPALHGPVKVVRMGAFRNRTRNERTQKETFAPVAGYPVSTRVPLCGPSARSAFGHEHPHLFGIANEIVHVEILH